MRHLNPFRFVKQLFYAVAIVCVLFSSTVLVPQPTPVFAQGVNTKASIQDQSLPDLSASSSKPGSFGKSSPHNGASKVDTSLTLSWKSSSHADRYEYCFDKSDNDDCGETWISTGTAREVTLTGLSHNETYYWQVRAVNAKGKTYANDKTWWSFETTNIAPGSFSKSKPVNADTGVSTSLTITWKSSSRADSYEYCYDQTNNDACSASWISTGTTRKATLTGLSHNKTYYWEVRAVNDKGKTYANDKTWWSFKTKKSK
jgi:predicted phage tail protein